MRKIRIASLVLLLTAARVSAQENVPPSGLTGFMIHLCDPKCPPDTPTKECVEKAIKCSSVVGCYRLSDEVCKRTCAEWAKAQPDFKFSYDVCFSKCDVDSCEDLRGKK